MIETRTGNLLDAAADALVNTVNCEGVMGRGLALQFKQAFPAMFKAYKRAAAAGAVVPGRMHVFATGAGEPPKYIINFPTKRRWREPSRMEDIEAGLIDLIAQAQALRLTTIAVPPLGSGLGGLPWAEVRARVVAAFDALPHVRVLLFEPSGAPQGAQRRAGPAPKPLSTARALFIKMLDLYSAESPIITMLEVQKLAYFLQVAGQPLRLRFQKHLFGPYAHNLNHALQQLEGHYLRGTSPDKPFQEVALVPGAAASADAALCGEDAATARLRRVLALCDGFEDPYGMELLATVHWVCEEDPAAAASPDRCVALVHAWSDRKRKLFPPDHIRLALLSLREQGWLSPASP